MLTLPRERGKLIARGLSIGMNVTVSGRRLAARLYNLPSQIYSESLLNCAPSIIRPTLYAQSVGDIPGTVVLLRNTVDYETGR